jgi:dihydrofolate reductase
MRRIVTYIATSADGYIGRPDGGVDWLERPQPRGNYGMAAFYRSIDTILWGRKTYDLAIEFQKRGLKGAEFDPGKTHNAFSHHPPATPAAGVEFVTEPIDRFVERFRRRKGRNAWMMGGAGIIASFLDAGGIDEFIIHVIPVMIGEGIPLVAPRHRTIPLHLRSSRRFPDGVVRLHYEVRSHTARS